MHYHFCFLEGGTKGEGPPEGDNSPNDGHGDGTGAAQAEEQEDEVQQKGEPGTERETNSTAEKGTDWFDVVTLIDFSECHT